MPRSGGVVRADIRLALPKVSGRLEVLITPDRWVPPDGQPIRLAVEIDGVLEPAGGGWRLSGTYKGQLGGRAVSGALTGGVGPTEPREGPRRLAVDLGGRSGAASMVVCTGAGATAKNFRPPRSKTDAQMSAREVSAGGRTYVVVTVQKGPAPKARAAGEGIRVGGQTVGFDGGRLVLGR